MIERKAPKPKPCKVCKTRYQPRSMTQTACSPKCALKAQSIRREAQYQKDRARMDQVRSQGDRSKLVDGAQKAFNRYIRARDGMHCWACDIDYGQMHASHFVSRGASSHLRFDLQNVNCTCAQCNSSKSGNIIEYRKRLVGRYGLAKVEYLEHAPKVRKFDEDYLKRVRRIFNKRAKFYERLREK